MIYIFNYFRDSYYVKEGRELAFKKKKVNESIEFKILPNESEREGSINKTSETNSGNVDKSDSVNFNDFAPSPEHVTCFYLTPKSDDGISTSSVGSLVNTFNNKERSHTPYKYNKPYSSSSYSNNYSSSSKKKYSNYHNKIRTQEKLKQPQNKPVNKYNMAIPTTKSDQPQIKQNEEKTNISSTLTEETFPANVDTKIYEETMPPIESSTKSEESLPVKSSTIDTNITKAITEELTMKCLDIDDSIERIMDELKALKMEKEKLQEEIKILSSFKIERVYIEDKETFFQHVKSIREPSDYRFYDHNINVHINLRNKIKNIIKQRKSKRLNRAKKFNKIYESNQKEWEMIIENRNLNIKERTSIEDEENPRFKDNICDIPLFDYYEEEYTKYQFIDFNNKVNNLLDEEKEYSALNQWNPLEGGLFVKLYKVHKKDFVKIAEALNKTTKDVIQFYYLKKYSLQLKKPRLKHERM